VSDASLTEHGNLRAAAGRNDATGGRAESTITIGVATIFGSHSVTGLAIA
jgi:hypothetical protein